MWECSWLSPFYEEMDLTKIRQISYKYFLIWRENQGILGVAELVYLLTYLPTYLLTPRSRVILKKLTGSQLVKKFPTFYGTRMFITAFTNARQLSQSSASSIQSIPPHPTSWRSILILSSHLRLNLPTNLFPSGFPTQILYTPLPHTCYITRPFHSSRFDHPNNIWWGEEIIKVLIM